jgi:hypothetical protein
LAFRLITKINFPLEKNQLYGGALVPPEIRIDRDDGWSKPQPY